jgi:hypothetical protein
MNLFFYGVALSYKENTISYLYNDKFIINVKIVIYNEHHILTVYRKKEDGLIFLVNVEDVMHDNTLIRSFESGKNLTYAQYGENNRWINLEYYKDVKFIDKKVKELKRKDKFLTFDKEAYTNEKKEFVPYACGFYDGRKKNLYYVTDFNS